MRVNLKFISLYIKYLSFVLYANEYRLMYECIYIFHSILESGLYMSFCASSVGIHIILLHLVT